MRAETCSILWISEDPDLPVLNRPLGSALIRRCDSLEEASRLLRKTFFQLVLAQWNRERSIADFVKLKKQANQIPVIAVLEVFEWDLSLKLLGRGAHDVIGPGDWAPERLTKILCFALERDRWQGTQSWLERKLFEARKLENLRSLGSKIAEDFDVLLQAVIRNAHLAQQKIPAHSPALVNLKKVEAYALRAAELSDQILAFSGKSPSEPEQVNCSKLLWELKPLLETMVSKSIELCYEFEESAPIIEGDVEQLRQLVLCLVKNANEAGGETIRIGVGKKKIEPGETIALGGEQVLPPGSYASLWVVDSGGGIDAAIRARIMDPFFTTKISSKGVGLSIVQGIIQSHKGYISLKSETHRGTLVEVYFPLVPSEG